MGPSTFRFGRGQVLRKLAVIGRGRQYLPASPVGFVT